MALRKDGIAMGCEHCVFMGGDRDDVFEVSVPVDDEISSFTGAARVRCRVTPEEHHLTLVDLAGVSEEDGSTPLVRARVERVLERIAAHRVCGNEHLCPTEVVDRCRNGGNGKSDECDPSA